LGIERCRKAPPHRDRRSDELETVEKSATALEPSSSIIRQLFRTERTMTKDAEQFYTVRQTWSPFEPVYLHSYSTPNGVIDFGPNAVEAKRYETPEHAEAMRKLIVEDWQCRELKREVVRVTITQKVEVEEVSQVIA